jgi:MFS transporter, SP family, arabinose:H+ symporter
LLIAYCGSFSFSSGAVTWVYMSELFPLDVREKGQALGSNAHWVANAIISASFPVVLSISRSLPFYFFGAMMVLQFFIVMFAFPETKGRSLESDASVVASS